MTKDIYVIRNTENDMCYVGQSNDYLYRFRKHKEVARRNNHKYKSYLYNAMNELGIDKFYVELLESNVENYNEREIYWINKLNTLRPNGYNLARGGDWYPNLSGVMHHNATVQSEEDLFGIYEELQNTDYSIDEIASHFGVKPAIVYDINCGRTYKQDGYEYPLRKSRGLNKGALDRLTFDLKYSNYSYMELAEMYHISFEEVQSINAGRVWHREYIEYPIRKLIFCSKADVDKVVMIQKDLLSTDMSFEEIGEKYGCSKATVNRINFGYTHKNPEFKYPLRNRSNCIPQKILNSVYDKLINSDESINDIAKLAGVSDATIKRINNGQTRRYYDDRFTYPIRPI